MSLERLTARLRNARSRGQYDSIVSTKRRIAAALSGSAGSASARALGPGRPARHREGRPERKVPEI